MRLSFPPAPSYYALDNAWTSRESLRGDITCDVAVLGGGIAGCSAALHLAKRGYKVALLEARFVGYGASGRSGGQTIFGLAVEPAKARARGGPRGRAAFVRLVHRGVGPDAIADPGIRHRLRLPAQSCARRRETAPRAGTRAMGQGTARGLRLRIGAVAGSRRAAGPRAQRSLSWADSSTRAADICTR